MPDTKQVKCSICGHLIKTMSGAVAVQSAPVVCRDCFGQQTYEVASSWGFSNSPHSRSQASG